MSPFAALVDREVAPAVETLTREKCLELRAWGNAFLELQNFRIKQSNRFNVFQVANPLATTIMESLNQQEKQISQAMRKCFRESAPAINKWMKSDAAVGLGEHLVARLLGVIGNPRIAYPKHWEQIEGEAVLVDDLPYERSLSQLRAYCGLGDATFKRRKGMTADQVKRAGNPQAKVILRLLAESCIKQTGSAGCSMSTANSTFSSEQPADFPDYITPSVGKLNSVRAYTAPRRRSPYRDVYEDARLIYDARVEWTPTHAHNAALRVVAKAILKDLWQVSGPLQTVTRNAAEAS